MFQVEPTGTSYAHVGMKATMITDHLCETKPNSESTPHLISNDKTDRKDSLFSVVKSGTGVFDYSSDDTSDKYVLSTDVLYCSAPKSSKITADA